LDTNGNANIKPESLYHGSYNEKDLFSYRNQPDHKKLYTAKDHAFTDKNFSSCNDLDYALDYALDLFNNGANDRGQSDNGTARPKRRHSLDSACIPDPPPTTPCKDDNDSEYDFLLTRCNRNRYNARGTLIVDAPAVVEDADDNLQFDISDADLFTPNTTANISNSTAGGTPKSTRDETTPTTADKDSSHRRGPRRGRRLSLTGSRRRRSRSLCSQVEFSQNVIPDKLQHLMQPAHNYSFELEEANGAIIADGDDLQAFSSSLHSSGDDLQAFSSSLHSSCSMDSLIHKIPTIRPATSPLSLQSSSMHQSSMDGSRHSSFSSHSSKYASPASTSTGKHSFHSSSTLTPVLLVRLPPITIGRHAINLWRRWVADVP